MKKVEIDENSGFCFGVTAAIEKAEEELAKGETLYCLGDIVHNSREVERLEKMGLVTIDHERFAALKNAKVLLRAHGEPPQTYEIARRNNIEIIDATCPVVLKLQKRIKKEAEDDGGAARQIVIYGKKGHAEVLGLVGQTGGKAIVVENKEEADKLDFGRDICLYSQTTKSQEGFTAVRERIAARMEEGAGFRAYNTICKQVANRTPNIRRFALSHELILFVSSKQSSNGQMLYAECKKANANTFLIESADEVQPGMVENYGSIGICGATSTPKWLMENVLGRVKDFCAGKKNGEE